LTMKSLPRNLPIVLAFVGDSTITRDLLLIKCLKMDNAVYIIVIWLVKLIIEKLQVLNLINVVLKELFYTKKSHFIMNL
ncbi:MAG: hypothetical protein KBC84_05605, partial [Proteobacteria bacterium]|nr:hypothetical protein [Pseudomonadota bacterium]